MTGASTSRRAGHALDVAQAVGCHLHVCAGRQAGGLVVATAGREVIFLQAALLYG